MQASATTAAVTDASDDGEGVRARFFRRDKNYCPGQYFLNDPSFLWIYGAIILPDSIGQHCLLLSLLYVFSAAVTYS